MHCDEQRLAALLVCELGVDPATLSLDTQLADIADSLDWAALLTELDRQFQVHLDPEQARDLLSVGDLLRRVQDARLACA